MYFEELKEFEKDLKRLKKKYRSLNDDIKIVKQVLSVLPEARPPFSYRINNLGIESCVIKVKKIACKSLKGRGVNSGLRLIYAHYNSKNKDLMQIEKDENKKLSSEKIVFIELYHKNEKENENIDRIKKYFK